jgi:HEAT repeat protein
MMVRRVAVLALCTLLTAAAGCRLLDPWEDIDDPEMQWRADAAAALGAIEEDDPDRLDEAAQLLERRWRHKGRGEPVPLVRFAIIEAFAKLGTVRAAPIVLEGLHDPDPLVRSASARAAGRIGLTAHRADLIARLEKDDSPDVRAALATALAVIEDPDGEADLAAVPALIERLEDTAIVSVAAHSALQRLTLQPLERDAGAWRRWWRAWQGGAGTAAPPGDGDGDEGDDGSDGRKKQ